MSKASLKFEVVEEEVSSSAYSDGCSGSRSDCCTRVCTRDKKPSNDESIEAWDQYLEVNAGVLQY